MVSWLTKEALINIAHDTGVTASEPTTRNEWAQLMQTLGVKGIHIAEKDSQVATNKKAPNEFINTWSVDGLISESLQPAELGWGTHEATLPENAHTHTSGSSCAIYLDTPGGQTKVHSWVPSGPQDAYLITHNEAISISEYFTVSNEAGDVVFRPTCHYAYLPSPETIISLNELVTNSVTHTKKTVLAPESIETGTDELGVLLYGHAKNAFWYGSKLSIEETKKLAPNQNATGLQVSSAVLSGIIWMIQNPEQGIVEAEDMDYKFCLDLQRKYLGTVSGVYTDWYPTTTPITERTWQFTELLKA
jgi:homospermidine synthase